jgi:hypothetical protein
LAGDIGKIDMTGDAGKLLDAVYARSIVEKRGGNPR